MKALRLIDKGIGYASGALAVVGAVAIALMMVHVAVDVTGRYVFNHPLPATTEIVSYYYMVMVIALPFAYVTRSQGQIKVEMFTGWLPRRWLYLLEAAVGVVTLIYVGVLAWKTGQEAINKTILGEVHDAGTIQLATWPSRWVPAFGFGVMACAVALRIAADFRGFLQNSIRAADRGM